MAFWNGQVLAFGPGEFRTAATQETSDLLELLGVARMN
jgi:hypothetical protein